jgi:hypothetical protein
MGRPIHAEEEEVVSGKDVEENRLTKRCIAPMISCFIRHRWNDGNETTSKTSALRQAWLLEQEWSEAREDVELVTREAKRIKQIAVSSCDVRKYVSAETTWHIGRWESRSRPLVADDPSRLLDVGVKAKLGQDLLDETIPRHESALDYVPLTERSLMWKQKGSTVFTFQGLRPTNQEGEVGRL